MSDSPNPEPSSDSHPGNNPVARFAAGMIRAGIRFYQVAISPSLHAISGPGSGCRFSPSCSQYFLEAVKIHGPWKGALLGSRRICRCHPWGAMGYDPVPAPHNRTTRPSPAKTAQNFPPSTTKSV